MIYITIKLILIMKKQVVEKHEIKKHAPESPSHRLHALRQQFTTLGRTAMGYPTNNHIPHKELFAQFLDIHANNVGDPFVDSSFLMNTHEFEREALMFFADLYKIPRNAFWGYVTSGGTEGNMYGLFLARELYPNGVLYFSEDTHYSIIKTARMLHIPYRIIKSHENGEIDIQDLITNIQPNINQPVIISANVGTTMKGAVDNVDDIVQSLQQSGVKYYYIHCDAALFGMMLPFIKNAPDVDFTRPIGSVAISGHKFIGSALPCGVVLTYKQYSQYIAQKVEYIHSIDSTILGSRNAITPLILWNAIRTRGYKGFQQEAIAIIEKAIYVYEGLQKIEYPSYLNPYSNTVFFARPSDRLIKKYSLAVDRSIAHIVAMQSTTQEAMDEFLKDALDEFLRGLIFKST